MTLRRTVLLVLLATAALVAALYSWRQGPDRAQPGLSQILTMAPEDASVLFYADLAALRSSPILAPLLAAGPAPAADPEYMEFVKATGFDYTRDLDRVVLAWRTAPASPPAYQTVALAEGRFNREKISAYALRSGMMERQNGLEIYVVPSNTLRKSVALVFPGPSRTPSEEHRIALADGPGGATELAALFGSNSSSTLDAAMRERVLRVAGAAIFAVGHVPPAPESLAPDGLRSDQFNNLVRNLRGFSIAARPEHDHWKLVTEAECASSESARQLAGTLEGLRVLAQAALADPKTRQHLQPPFAALLETLLPAVAIVGPGLTNDTHVRVIADLTPEMINQVMGQAATGSKASPPK